MPFLLLLPIYFVPLQEHAYPADELMPLTCRGRVRGQEPSRGDVDDALGKWVLEIVIVMYEYVTILTQFAVRIGLDTSVDVFKTCVLKNGIPFAEEVRPVLRNCSGTGSKS